ncbi:MAG: Ku protein [Planctomycetaceae bacterium]|nr:Ku protein [Planctomycetaceae bacterium]
MARAIWKGTIQFGPVRVPVKLYTAVEDQRARARLLHDKDQQPLEQRMVCSEEDKAVERQDMVKGYPLDKQRYVVIEADELESLSPASSRDVNVVEFVDAEQPDPRYMDRTYYLGPDEQPQRYTDLAESLRRAHLAGVCRWAMRKKNYLGLLECADAALSLTTCRFPEEVIAEDNLDIPETSLGEKEKKAAMQLISAMEDEFRPEQYKDEYQDRLKHLIEQKAKGEKVTLAKPKKPSRTKEENLLSTLQSSLQTLTKDRPKASQHKARTKE